MTTKIVQRINAEGNFLGTIRKTTDELENEEMLLADLQKKYEYPICGTLFVHENAGELFCTRKVNHKRGHAFEEEARPPEAYPPPLSTRPTT
jgi:hypothetical protein